MARKAIDLRQYLRRPDRDFWLELLREPPRPTETATVRRARIARAALGLATVVSSLYAAVSAVVMWHSALPVVAANTVFAMVFGTGMWMASLGKHVIARLILMVGINAHIAMLLWLTGDALGIGIYAVVTAALSAALFSEEERPLRVFFFLLPAMLFLFSIGVSTSPHFSLSDMSP
ncbi:MAG: hypothetical protein ACLGHG_00460, partial [Gammaproteobacteria bacterium]